MAVKGKTPQPVHKLVNLSSVQRLSHKMTGSFPLESLHFYSAETKHAILSRESFPLSRTSQCMVEIFFSWCRFFISISHLLIENSPYNNENVARSIKILDRLFCYFLNMSRECFYGTLLNLKVCELIMIRKHLKLYPNPIKTLSISHVIFPPKSIFLSCHLFLLIYKFSSCHLKLLE